MNSLRRMFSAFFMAVNVDFALRCIWCGIFMWFDVFVAPIVDCKMIWLGWNTFAVVAVVIMLVAVTMAATFGGDDEVEDADFLFWWESIWLTFILVGIDLIEFNAVEPLSLRSNGDAAIRVVVLSIGKFGWCTPADINEDDGDGDADAFAFDWSYSYFKTDVGLIGIDKFVLCLFSMIDVVSLAILDPSAVAFVMPKCNDCCLKIDRVKFQSKWKRKRGFVYLANAMR